MCRCQPALAKASPIPFAIFLIAISPCLKSHLLLRFVPVQHVSHRVCNPSAFQHPLASTTKDKRMRVGYLWQTSHQKRASNFGWSWIRSPSCMGVFCAPPCGTCSKARGIPITLPNGAKIAGPQPLRSECQPDGVDCMSYLNRRRVWSANTLYKFISDVCLFCLDLGMIVVVESPRSSLYWRTTLFAPLRRKLRFTAHQACAYGSNRPKWTVLAHNTTSLLGLCKTCPGLSQSHKHKPWGMVQNHDQPNSQKFSTAEETAYPPLLAYTIAFCIAQELLHRGWNPPGIEFSEPETVSYQYLRSVVGTQPKASKLPPLLSEYSHVLCLQVPQMDCLFSMVSNFRTPFSMCLQGRNCYVAHHCG